jgi:hypothetical protein
MLAQPYSSTTDKILILIHLWTPQHYVSTALTFEKFSLRENKNVNDNDLRH